MTDTVIALIACGAGAIVVPFTSLFKNRQWSQKAKTFLAFVISTLASLGITVPIDVTNAGDIHAGYVTAIVFTVSQLLYKAAGFNETKANEKLTNTLVKPRNAE